MTLAFARYAHRMRPLFHLGKYKSVKQWIRRSLYKPNNTVLLLPATSGLCQTDAKFGESGKKYLGSDWVGRAMMERSLKTWKWLRKGEFKTETEGLIIAAQAVFTDK